MLPVSHRSFVHVALGLTISSAISVAAIKTGPATGERIPNFSALDQSGKTQTLQTIAGPKGAMLVFYRPADG